MIQQKTNHEEIKDSNLVLLVEKTSDLAKLR